MGIFWVVLVLYRCTLIEVKERNMKHDRPVKYEHRHVKYPVFLKKRAKGYLCLFPIAPKKVFDLQVPSIFKMTYFGNEHQRTATIRFLNHSPFRKRQN